MKPATVIMVGVLAFLAYKLADKRLDQESSPAPSPSQPAPKSQDAKGGSDVFGSIASIFRDATKVVAQLSPKTT